MLCFCMALTLRIPDPRSIVRRLFEIRLWYPTLNECLGAIRVTWRRSCAARRRRRGVARGYELDIVGRGAIAEALAAAESCRHGSRWCYNFTEVPRTHANDADSADKQTDRNHHR